MDQDYFDARFDGLADLIASQHADTLRRMGAMEVRMDRQEDGFGSHMKDTSAHGHGVLRDILSASAAWLGVVLAAVLAAIEWKKHP